MEIIFIVAGFVGLGLLFYFFQRKKKSNAPYFKIKKKLEEELLQANFSGEWEKKQEINLKLIWLKTVEEVESKDIFSKKKETHEVESLLINLSEDEIKFPNKWKLDDLYHFPFSQEIIAGYGKALAENDYKGIYKPESILPFPKDMIKKAIYFTFDYLNYDKPLYEIPNKQKVADNLNNVKFILTENFVDTSKKYLPRDGLENFRVGQQLREEQPYKEEGDLFLIDWRSCLQWVAQAVRYADEGLFNYASVCIEKAKRIDPQNKDIKVVEKMLYQYVEGHHNKKKKVLK